MAAMFMQSKIPEPVSSSPVTASDAHAVASEMPWYTIEAWLAEQVSEASPWAITASAMSNVDVSLAMMLAPVIFGR